MSKTETKVGWTPGTFGQLNDGMTFRIETAIYTVIGTPERYALGYLHIPVRREDGSVTEIRVSEWHECETQSNWASDLIDRITDTAEADWQRLISKAPEMAELLRRLLPYVPDEGDEDRDVREAVIDLLAEIGGAGLTVTNSK